MLVTTVFITTACVYALACVLYLTFLIRGSQKLVWYCRATLGLAAALHIAYIASEWAVKGAPPISDIHQTLAASSLGIVVAFFIASARHRIAVLGAFITPVTLLFFLGAGLGRTAHVPETVRSALLPVHIGVNVLGIVAFAFAFAAAVGYVLQERMLRRKQLGGLFQRLPALDLLDSIGFRAVIVGFPLLTIGIVSGAFWAVQLHKGTAAISAAQGFALLAWLVFAGVLLLRVAAGWRGRRAAIGTIFGFLCALAVLLLYFVRSSEGV